MRHFFFFKFCSLLVLLFNSHTNAIAQSRSFSIETGMTHSFYRPTDKKVSLQNSVMYDVGGSFGLKGKLPLTITVGLFCVANGINFRSEEDIISGSTNTYRFQHLQLPINIGYKKRLGYGSLWVQSGLNIGYNFRAVKESWIRNKPVNEDSLTIEKAKIFGVDGNKVSRFDVGICASVGYEMPFGVFAKIQYYYGLNKMELSSIGLIRRQFLNLNIGYTFKIK